MRFPTWIFTEKGILSPIRRAYVQRSQILNLLTIADVRQVVGFW